MSYIAPRQNRPRSVCVTALLFCLEVQPSSERTGKHDWLPAQRKMKIRFAQTRTAQPIKQCKSLTFVNLYLLSLLCGGLLDPSLSLLVPAVHFCTIRSWQKRLSLSFIPCRVISPSSPSFLFRIAPQVSVFILQNGCTISASIERPHLLHICGIFVCYLDMYMAFKAEHRR